MSQESDITFALHVIWGMITGVNSNVAYGFLQARAKSQIQLLLPYIVRLFQDLPHFAIKLHEFPIKSQLIPESSSQNHDLNLAITRVDRVCSFNVPLDT